MNKTVIHIEYGGKYLGEGGGRSGWNSKEAQGCALSFKEEITYMMLVDRICKKIGVDEGKVKISYVPLLLKPVRVLDILDDDDIDGYISSIDKDHCRSALHVEIIQCEEQGLRGDKGSSFGVNYGEKDYNALDSAIIRYEEPNQNVGDGENVVNDNVDDDFDFENDVVRDAFIELPPCDDEEEQQFVEEWEDGTGLELNQEFVSKTQLQNLLLRASLKECYEFDILNSDSWRYVVKCRSEGCKWYLRVARPQYSKEKWSVKTYRNMHSCSRAVASTTTSKRKGTPQLVADVIHEEYPGVLETPAPKILMDLVLSKVGVKLSYPTALRGKNLAAAVVRGSPEESYKMLPSYLYVLEKLNIGTKTSLMLDKEKRFKYLFVALGACIEGFSCMRKVLSVDATFLKYGGVLIFAIAQDPNRHHYPIAFAVVDGEKDASWKWFFTTLLTIVPDDPQLVFVSDRNASLIKAIAEMYPKCQHGFCVYHLSQNVKGRAPNGLKDYVAEKFRELGEIYTQVEFDKEYEDFRRRFPKVAKYLDKSVDVSKWARCYFKGARYNIMTTNCSESMNNVFRKARTYALLPMIDAIVGKIAEWFNRHRKKSANAPKTHKMVPFVENVLHPSCKIGSKLKVHVLNSFELEFNVIGNDGKTYFVDLRKKSCSCRCFDIDMYPCVHAVAAVVDYGKMEDRSIDINVYDLCSKDFKLETWSMAYYRTIYLVPHKCHWQIPGTILSECSLPPIYPTRKGKGRYQETRYRSPGEGPVKKRKTSNKSMPGLSLREWIGLPRRSGDIPATSNN